MAKIFKGSEYKSSIDLKTKVDLEDRVDVFEEPKSSGIVSKEILDAQSKARLILEEAKKEGSKIKKEAKEILEQVKVEMENSKKQGEERGYDEGLQRALEYLNQLYLLKEKMFSNVEPQLVKLAYAIAEKIIHQQIEENNQAIVSIVKQAVSEAVGQKMFVKINPEDFAKMKESESALMSQIEPSKTISFKADPTIQSGGCVVESEVGALDAQLEHQMKAIKKALGLNEKDE